MHLWKNIDQQSGPATQWAECGEHVEKHILQTPVITLDSGIDIGPTFIIFGFFSKPYGLIKGPTFIDLWDFF